jgi:hypothetical protein
MQESKQKNGKKCEGTFMAIGSKNVRRSIRAWGNVDTFSTYFTTVILLLTCGGTFTHLTTRKVPHETLIAAIAAKINHK